MLAGTLAEGGPRHHLAPGLAREDDTLVVESAGGNVTIDVAGWEVVPDPGSELVALARRTGDERQLRILDRRGKTLGTVTAPLGWIPAATDEGVVLLPDALHGPIVSHALRFLAFDGTLRREVEEPALGLLESRIMPGGRFVTVSAGGATDHEWTILAYDASGTELWRHAVAGSVPPEALVTADGQRLVVLERDIDRRTSTITVLRAGHRPKEHHLPMVAQLVADPGSARVAAVGQRVVAVIDTDSRKLKWRRDDPIAVPLLGGVRFDRRGPRLFVVAAEEDRTTKQARLRLRTYRLSDGADEREELGEVPAKYLPPVADVDVAPDGGHRVHLYDRAVTATPERGAR